MFIKNIQKHDEYSYHEDSLIDKQFVDFSLPVTNEDDPSDVIELCTTKREINTKYNYHEIDHLVDENDVKKRY